MVSFGVICASNQNRSMAGHNLLSAKGFDVASYGTGSSVRLPGPSIDQPQVYPFGTLYKDIHKDLLEKDEVLYTANGLLKLMERNQTIKDAPQKFQDTKDRQHDVLICCEERCFDSVCEGKQNIVEMAKHRMRLTCDENTELYCRGGEQHIPVHLINIEIKDNHESAAFGAEVILDLCQKINAAEDLDHSIESIIETLCDTYASSLQTSGIYHTLLFY